MDKFSGDSSVYRMWMFNLGVALGQVDSRLAEEVRKLMSREDASRFPNDWDPSKDSQVDNVIYHKYKTAMYRVLVSLTSGEPLGILRGLQDTPFQSDGYKALVVFSQRFYVKTSSSMLSSFLEVVSPKVVKDKDLIPAIHLWERRAADLRTRYGEDIKGSFKRTVFMSMLP
eukprot:12410835-Karenia_brevis.AAC.1